MIAYVFGLSFLSWVLLALGLPRHHVAWFGKPPTLLRRRLLRGFGWTGLPLGWLLAVQSQGYEFGSVLWAVVVMVSALAWTLLLTARESITATAGSRSRAGGVHPEGRRRCRS